MTKTKYIVMTINEVTHKAKKSKVTTNLTKAQQEVAARTGQGLRAYYIRQEVEC